MVVGALVGEDVAIPAVREPARWFLPHHHRDAVSGQAVVFNRTGPGSAHPRLLERFTAHCTSNFEPQYWEENLSRQELQEAVNRSYQSFDERPGYIAQRRLQVRSPGELMPKARAAMKVFLMQPGK